MSRTYTVRLATDTHAVTYVGVPGDDADHAAAKAVETAEDQIGRLSGWVLDGPVELEPNPVATMQHGRVERKAEGGEDELLERRRRARLRRLRTLIRLSRESLAGPLGELERREAAAKLAGYEREAASLLPPVGGGSQELDELRLDVHRAERELAAIRERRAVGQELAGDADAAEELERIAAELRALDPFAAPPAPVILVTTAHPTLAQHPGPDGETVHPRLGRLVQPRHLSSVELTAAAGIPWAADNDCFQGLDERAFVRMLDRLEGLAGCLFVTVPDVVADADATLEHFARWAPELERRGLPLGLVAQDGLTADRVPWARLAALFVGGSDDFKLGPDAAELAREAKRRGLWVHWGRVNSRRRFDLIVDTGAADSFDGSKWARFRNTYLPGGLGWLEEAQERRELALATYTGAVRELLAPVAVAV